MKGSRFWVHLEVLMKKLMSFMALVLVAQGYAESRFVDSASLYQCGGRVELRESQDNLHLQFDSVDACDTLVVQTDWGTVLERYSFRKGGRRAPYSPSYTLSKEMWRQLGRGSLVLKVSGSGFFAAQDRVSLRVNPFAGPDLGGRPPRQCGGHTSRNFTGWALTNTCKCAYYRRGEFQRHAQPWEERNCN
jgi:hypothetical protein